MENNRTVIEIQDKIKVLEEKINSMEALYFKNSKNIDYSEIRLLWNEVSKLKQKILFLEGPTYSSENLDLYLDRDANLIGKECEIFKIFLAGSNIFIGTIRVTYDNMRDNFLGNIGYELKREYRGNGYMLETLNILRKPLINKGLTKPIITTKKDNYASIKTIKNYGGVKLEDDKWYNIFEVDLGKEVDENKKTF